MSKVYTFGPTFRAEKSQTNRHLSEFWMVEPEMAHASLADVCDHAEGLVRFVTAETMRLRADDLEFCAQRTDKTLLARLRSYVERPFVRMTYTDAVRVLREALARQRGSGGAAGGGTPRGGASLDGAIASLEAELRQLDAFRYASCLARDF